MVPFRITFVGLALAIGAAADGDGLSQEYCSSENTGSDYSAVHNIYQSNGACLGQCLGSYAFAVVQYQDCWCSNYIPADQQSVSNCNQDCPGYPDDKCGNASEGLYGYIALSIQPSGTAGAASSTQASSTPASSTSSEPVSTTSSPLASSTSSTTQSPTTQQASTTKQAPPSSPQQQQTSYTPASTSSSATLATSTYSSSFSSSTSYAATSSSTIVSVVAPVPATTEVSSSSMKPPAAPSPVTSVRVVTISGAVVTQTVTTTPLVAPNSDPASAQLQRKSLSGGAIAGIVVGSLLFAALLFGALLLWRRRKQDGDAEDPGAGRGPNNPRRTTSVLSRTGLLSRARPVSVTEKDVDDPLYVNTNTGNNSVRHSMMFAAGGAGEGVSPVSPLGNSQETDSQRRLSRPLVYDQRLNPSALFMNPDANGSRVSMQDQQDYSRPLGIMNPDPRPSFESRTSRA
ncbi:hypothetical protein LTR36_009677 [Oleoguttula mirabilis]|uniref:WSC domain-containing protein n=1 Tax=Oleoguttula mirabilis TaxID=1507867 RepID=A0AAV9J5D3_9PEZI|nr:hypothetical protein LTR36_009677 [Oleoguttula mirabilis]